MVFAIALFIHAIILAVDEFYCHQKRDLPRFERWGHPIDSLGFLACIVIAAHPRWFGAHHALAYMISAGFSCLLITKDEFIHKTRCSSFELWLHACLFVLHPIVLFAVWQIATTTPLAVEIYAIAIVLVTTAQIFIWNKNILPSLSTIKHLRFGFSIFLMPIFFLALSLSGNVSWSRVIELFLILALGIFSSSNGYNSYYDRDETSIGGLEKPPRVENDLLVWSILIEAVALLLLFKVFGLAPALIVLLYGVFSKLYSHPKIRLKKYPLISYLIVVLFQGVAIFLTCLMCFNDASLATVSSNFIWGGLLASALIIGGSYPITQIYQHAEDTRRGDRTLSAVLGSENTLRLASILFMVSAIVIISIWRFSWPTAIFLLAALPAVLYLRQWQKLLRHDRSGANFYRTDRFLKLSSLCANVSFILIWLIRR